MRRRAIQSGIEWPHRRRLGALGIEAGEQPRPLVGNAAQDRVDDPRARTRAFGPRSARAWRTAWSTAARGGTPSEGELVGADPQDVSHRGLQRAGPVQRAVDEPVEGAAALHRAVGQPGRLGAGPRVEAGPAGLGGQGPVGIGPPVHATQHAEGDGALAGDPVGHRLGHRTPRRRGAAPPPQERRRVHSPLARRLQPQRASDPSPVAATSRPPSAASRSRGLPRLAARGPDLERLAADRQRRAHVGRQRRTCRASSAAGRERSSGRSSAVILGACETPSWGWATGWRRPAARSSSTSASSGAPGSLSRAVSDPASSSSPISTCRDASIGPVSSPASICMIVTPVGRAAHDRALHRGSAATGGEQGEVDVDRGPPRQHGLAQDLPERDDRERPRAVRRSPRRPRGR